MKYRKTSKTILYGLFVLTITFLLNCTLIISIPFALIFVIPVIPFHLRLLVDTLFYYVELTEEGINEFYFFRKNFIKYSEVIDMYKCNLEKDKKVIIIEGQNSNLLEIYCDEINRSEELYSHLSNNIKANNKIEKNGYQNIVGQRNLMFKKKSRKYVTYIMIMVTIIALIRFLYFI